MIFFGTGRYHIFCKSLLVGFKVRIIQTVYLNIGFGDYYDYTTHDASTSTVVYYAVFVE